MDCLVELVASSVITLVDAEVIYKPIISIARVQYQFVVEQLLFRRPKTQNEDIVVKTYLICVVVSFGIFTFTIRDHNSLW